MLSAAYDIVAQIKNTFHRNQQFDVWDNVHMKWIRYWMMQKIKIHFIWPCSISTMTVAPHHTAYKYTQHTKHWDVVLEMCSKICCVTKWQSSKKKKHVGINSHLHVGAVTLQLQSVNVIVCVQCIYYYFTWLGECCMQPIMILMWLLDSVFIYRSFQAFALSNSILHHHHHHWGYPLLLSAHFDYVVHGARACCSQNLQHPVEIA